MSAVGAIPYRSVDRCDAHAITPVKAKIAAVLSMLIWTGVIFGGRFCPSALGRHQTGSASLTVACMGVIIVISSPQCTTVG